MHELSLAQALVEEVERIKERERAGRVVSVTVGIGALSGVDRESFASAFPMAADGTPLEGVELVIREIPAAVRCADCGQESRPDLAFVRCGHCGSAKVELTAGRDFLIQAIDVEDEESGDSHDV